LIDPEVIDQTVAAYFGLIEGLIINGKSTTISGSTRGDRLAWDFAANRLPPPWRRTFPIGLDTEVCSFEAMETAWTDADQPHQREHVMPYLYEHPETFRVLLVNHEPDYGHLRWTVDTAEDLELVRRIYAHLGIGQNFHWRDVLDVIRQHPDLTLINAGVQHKLVNNIDERARDRLTGRGARR
jgi:spore coat polysaccharide biosynthesis protein SpsF